MDSQLDQPRLEGKRGMDEGWKGGGKNSEALRGGGRRGKEKSVSQCRQGGGESLLQMPIPTALWTWFSRRTDAVATRDSVSNVVATWMADRYVRDCAHPEMRIMISPWESNSAQTPIRL